MSAGGGAPGGGDGGGTRAYHAAAAAASAAAALAPIAYSFADSLKALQQGTFTGPPVLEEGDVMVLSHALKGEAAACLRSAWASYPGLQCHGASAGLGRGAGRGRHSGGGRGGRGDPAPLACVRELLGFPSGEQHESFGVTSGEMLDSCAAAIEAAAGLRPGQRLPLPGLLSRLHVDVPVAGAFEEYTVPETDPRAGLRGERGLRVSGHRGRPIQAGTFVGFFRSEVRFKAAHTDFLRQPPRAWAETVGPCPALWKLAVGSYTAEVVSFKPLEELSRRPEIDFLFDSSRGPSQYTLCASALGCGNATMRVNAPQLDPYTSEGYHRRGGSLGENCHLLEVVVAGWPFLAYFCTRSLQPGEDLRCNYGWEEYFKIVWEELREAEGAEELRQLRRRNAELEQLLAQLREAPVGGEGSGGGGGDQLTAPTAAAAAAASAPKDALSADREEEPAASVSGQSGGTARPAKERAATWPRRTSQGVPQVAAGAAAGLALAGTPATAAAHGEQRRATSKTQSTHAPRPTRRRRQQEQQQQQQRQEQRQKQEQQQQQQAARQKSPEWEEQQSWDTCNGLPLGGSSHDEVNTPAGDAAAERLAHQGDALAATEGQATIGKAALAQKERWQWQEEAWRKREAEETRGGKVHQQAAGARKKRPAEGEPAAGQQPQQRRQQRRRLLGQQPQHGGSGGVIDLTHLAELPPPPASAAGAGEGCRRGKQLALQAAPKQQAAQQQRQQAAPQPLQQQPEQESGAVIDLTADD